MEKEIAEKVIEKLSSITESTGKNVQFSASGYEAVDFDKENFHSINGSDGRVVFIDGGNNSVFESSRFSLQFARIYWTLYSDNKRVKSSKKEFFVLASSSSSSIELEMFGGESGVKRIDAFDKNLSKGGHRVNVSEAANAVRKLAEVQEAIELVDSLNSGDIIALDRDLQVSVTGEKEVLDLLFEKAYAKGVVVCGICKTTRLFTDTGDSVVAAISSISPSGEWAYYPLAKINTDSHKAEMMIVKLHSKSKYIFRFEIFEKQKDKVSSVLGVLKKNASDPVFLGYPYGLIEADKMARVGNDEAEYLKVKLTSKAGDKRDKIINYMKTVDAHSVLDNIS